MGLGVYSSVNKLMGAESATIVKTAEGEDPRNYIKICSGKPFKTLAQAFFIDALKTLSNNQDEASHLLYFRYLQSSLYSLKVLRNFRKIIILL